MKIKKDSFNLDLVSDSEFELKSSWTKFYSWLLSDNYDPYFEEAFLNNLKLEPLLKFFYFSWKELP